MKKFSALLLALCLVAGFASCDKSDKKEKSAESSANSRSMVESTTKEFPNVASTWVNLWNQSQALDCTYSTSYSKETNLTTVCAAFINDEANPSQKASEIENYIKTTLQYEDVKDIIHLAIVIYDKSGNTVLSTVDGQPV